MQINTDISRFQDDEQLCLSSSHFVADSRMTRNEELDLLQNAELKQAFDEFDKVHLFKYKYKVYAHCTAKLS